MGKLDDLKDKIDGTIKRYALDYVDADAKSGKEILEKIRLLKELRKKIKLAEEKALYADIDELKEFCNKLFGVNYYERL